MEDMAEQTTENKMGVMPVNRLIITMSLPMIASMLVQALYNVVDSIFVARLSEEALAAVSLAFPVQNLMIAVAGGTGVGINAFLSRSLGEKKYKEVNRAATNGLFVILLSYIVFALFGMFFSTLYFRTQTDIPELLDYGVAYLSIVTTASFGLFFTMTFERLLQSTGMTVYSMISQMTGAIINIILDPILIFGLCGMPRLEVAGAAIATVIGQCVGMCISFTLNILKNKEISLSLRGFHPDLHTIRQIYHVGVPSIIMQAIGSVLTFSLNQILLMFSSTAVSVYGAYFKLQSFAFLPVFGLNNGLTPIIAYNYGARKKDRIYHAIRSSIFIATGIMLVALAIFQILPGQLLSLFSSGESSGLFYEIGIPALRTLSVSFILAGFSVITTATFQALGEGFYSLFISLLRQIIIILPLSYFLAVNFGLNALWLAFPIAELIAALLCVYLLFRINNKILKKL